MHNGQATASASAADLPDYEYKGLIAQAWDVFRGDTSGWSDGIFYRKIIERYGQPVLDIGCGTGRLLLDYLAQGLEVEGVDNSPEMLALCRHKAAALGLAPVVYEQPMETLALPRQYRTILIPSSSLQLVTEPALVVRALAQIYRHLLPGGVVAASVMTLWKTGDPLESESERTAVRAKDGATFRQVGRCRYEPVNECEHTEDTYQMIVAGQVVAEERHRRSPATRSYTAAQARTLFAGAGFSAVDLYSEFTFEPVKPTDTLFTVVAQKANQP